MWTLLGTLHTSIKCQNEVICEKFIYINAVLGLFITYSCISVCFAHECRNLWRPEEDIRFLSSNSDLLLWLGAGNWAQVPCKGSKHSSPRSRHLSSTLLEYLNVLLRPIVTHKMSFSSLKSTLLISQLACFIRPSSNTEIVSTLQTLSQEQFCTPTYIHFIIQ